MWQGYPRASFGSCVEVFRKDLVHGAFGGAWCWEPVTGQLEAAGHTVEAFDFPGSGADETPVADVTFDAYADRVCATLAERPEPAVVGYSMGGVVITRAAQQCAERIASLVFVCLHAVERPEPARHDAAAGGEGRP